MDIKEKLDRLAEFHTQKAAIELRKRELLDSVKVPAEVQAVVSAGTKRISDIDNGYRAEMQSVDTEAEAALAEIVIPEEIRAALAEIDAKRRAVTERQSKQKAAIMRAIQDTKLRIQAEIDAQVKDVYAALDARKREIEAEFAGQQAAADANIAALEAEIKADVKTVGETVKGKFYKAVFRKGQQGKFRQAEMMGYAVTHPEVLQFKDPDGEPSVAIMPV